METGLGVMHSLVSFGDVLISFEIEMSISEDDDRPHTTGLSSRIFIICNA